MEEGGFGPHVIKMGHYDEAMMERVCQKYKKMGYSVQMKGNIIKLNVINAQTCLQVNLYNALSPIFVRQNYVFVDEYWSSISVNV